jgi:rRNA maturation endonuclease Nob1
MDLVTATVIYCFLVAGVFLGLWVYYDRRDHARFEAERRHVSFQCMNCRHLYAVQGEHPQSTCPRCGQQNDRLRF